MMNRFRIVAAAAAFMAVPVVASAQENQFNVGTKVFNVGVLVAEEGYGGTGLGAGFEVGVKEIAGQVRLGVGASAGFLRNSNHYGLGGFRYGYDLTVIPVVGFVNGHYQLKQVPQLDLYAGPVLGIARVSYSWDDNYTGSSDVYADKTDVAVGIQAGARYFFAGNLAGAVQLSAGSSSLPFLNAGIAIKF